MQPSISHHIETGPSSVGKGLSSLFIALPLAVAGYLVYQNQLDSKLIAPWPWLTFWAGCLALLAVSPWRPTVGLFAYIVAAYGTPRYGEAYGAMMSFQVLNWICGLAVLGWIAGSIRLRLKPRNPGLFIWPLLVFLIWQIVCVVMMLNRGDTWNPHPNHHPELYAQGLVMFILAGQLLRTDSDATHFAIVIGATLCGRWALSGYSGVLLEGDIPAIAVIAIPVMLIGLKSSWSGLTKLILFGICVALIVLILMTQNRNALVAFVILIPALWLTAKAKLPVFIMTIPALIIAGIVFAQSSNWKRFEALFTGGDDANSANERLLIWHSGWNMAKANPLFGVGPGNFHNEFANHQPSDGETLRVGNNANAANLNGSKKAAHNSVIHTLGESGFIGAAAYLALFGGAALFSLLSKPPTDLRGQPQYGWPFHGVKLLFPAIMAYLAIGMFLSRQDMVLAYLLVGWFSAIYAKHRHTLAKERQAKTPNATAA